MFRISTLVLAFSLATPAFADVKVVASISPIHSIAAAVMQGAGAPALLVDGANSPHTYALTPANAQSIQDAQLILWIGPDLEAFLKKPLGSLGENATQRALLSLPGLELHLQRESHSHEEGEDVQGKPSTDPHIWLSPKNAIVIANSIANELAALDPEKSNLYKDNAAIFAKSVEAAEAEIRTTISNLKPQKAIVFHDAYQYLEKYFGLPASEALSIHPENPPGAAALNAIREDIKADKAACIFTEPQFDTKLVNTVTEGSDIYVGTLDPYGSTLPAGPTQYTSTLKALAESWKSCFK